MQFGFAPTLKQRHLLLVGLRHLSTTARLSLDYEQNPLWYLNNIQYCTTVPPRPLPSVCGCNGRAGRQSL